MLVTKPGLLLQNSEAQLQAREAGVLRAGGLRDRRYDRGVRLALRDCERGCGGAHVYGEEPQPLPAYAPTRLSHLAI